jgi:alpha-L-rhamnosidase
MKAKRTTMNSTLSLLAALLLAPLATLHAASGFQVSGLKTDYRQNPLGLETRHLRFFWRVSEGEQTAWQAQAASSAEKLAADKADLWDTGKHVGAETTQVAYEGKPLASRQRVWWRVRAWDKTGKESPWSEPARFEMALLKDEDWRGAQWIGCDRKFDAPQYAPKDRTGPWIQPPPGREVISLFKDLVLPDKAVVSAMAWWGLSKKAGQAAVVANFDEVEGYVRGRLARIQTPRESGFIDLAFFLKPGKTNRIELRFENPARNFAGTVGMLIVFADGTEMTLASGGDWKARLPESKEAPLAVAVAEPYGGPTFGQAKQFTNTDLPPAWFRGKLSVRSGLTRASLYLSALGQGQAFVNGRPVDDTLLSPPQSDYEEWAFYTTQDITKLLQPGANALSVLLDPGWYHEVGGFGHGFSYGRPGLKALVALDYADGQTEWFITGPGWQWKEGAIRSANIYRGERVDFRKDHDEWKTPDVGSGWNQAQVIPPVSPKTIPMDLSPIRRGQQLKPVKNCQIGPKSWLFDVGEMIHGWVRFTMNEPAGATVRLRYSEYARDGVIENVPASHWWCHGVPQSDEVIADGKSRVFEPMFTPKSFRFVQISGLSRQPDDLVAFTVHSDARPLATFESSDPMLNRLFANGMRTWRNYVNHFIVDIPRERCVWGAESIYSEIPATYCYDLAANHRLMNRVWLTGAMTREGIPGNIGVGKRLSTATSGYIWSVSPLFIASKLFEHYGDLDPARTYYDKLRFLVLEYPRTNSERDGTIPTPYLLADHAPISDVKRNPARGDLITAMVYFESLNRFARLADALGKPDDASHARQHAEKVRGTVMSFYDTAQHTFNNGTHDSLALAYGLVADRAEQEKVAASLAGYYRANGHQFDGGFMSYEIYPQLSRHGYGDDAVRMLVNTEPPGPARSAKEDDATTFWEAYYLDHDFQMNRGLNFVAFAHSIGWMITDLAGIRCDPAVPGGQRLILEPAVPKSERLEWVQASLQTAQGMAKSAWKLAQTKLHWEVTVPPNTVAEVRIPTADAASVKGAEKLKPLGSRSGHAVYEATSGTYTFSATVERTPLPVAPRPAPTDRKNAGSKMSAQGNATDWRLSGGVPVPVNATGARLCSGAKDNQMLTTAVPSRTSGPLKSASA